MQILVMHGGCKHGYVLRRHQKRLPTLYACIYFQFFFYKTLHYDELSVKKLKSAEV